MPLRPWLLQQEWTEIPRDRLERTFHTNIIAMMSLAQKAVKHMPKGGSIINISSVQAYGEQGSGMPGLVGGHSCKSCSKGVAAVGLWQCMCMLMSSGWVSLHSHRCRTSVGVSCGRSGSWQPFSSPFMSTQSYAAVCCPSLPCHPHRCDCREACVAALLIARIDVDTVLVSNVTRSCLQAPNLPFWIMPSPRSAFYIMASAWRASPRKQSCICEQHMLTLACYLQGAIVTLTKGLAPVLMPKGIRVNAIAPGPVWTPLVRLR